MGRIGAARRVASKGLEPRRVNWRSLRPMSPSGDTGSRGPALIALPIAIRFG